MGRFNYLFNKAKNRLYYEIFFALQKPDNGLISIHPKEVKYPVYLRKGMSDIPTFYQIFYSRQYDINYNLVPKTIIDCGANIGLSAVYFKSLFPDATIIAIEPEASNFELLRKNTEKYDNVHCLNYGVWPTDTNLEITNKDTAENWGFMTVESDTATDHTIPAISIDSILAKYDVATIDILKIDIEGSEKDLFERNFERWLPKVKVLVIEIHDHMRTGCALSVLKAVTNYNFSMYQGEESLIFHFNDH